MCPPLFFFFVPKSFSGYHCQLQVESVHASYQQFCVDAIDSHTMVLFECGVGGDIWGRTKVCRFVHH